MAESVCCPLFKVVECADTKQHKHLFCDSQYTMGKLAIDNEWVKMFCISEFTECKYYAKYYAMVVTNPKEGEG